MDSDEVSEECRENCKDLEAGPVRTAVRSFSFLAFGFFIFLFLSFTVMNVSVLIENFPFWSPISVHSRCRIVSSSVDLRSSKTCELGLLNYNAKDVFHQRKKYRCRYDYYWASIFKVEFTDHTGNVRFALAEVPNEALPHNCRPDFSRAWLTKYKFKLNESYDCCYTLGIYKVNINHEDFLNCRADDPSTIEMMKRYLIPYMRIPTLSFWGWGSFRQWRWDAIASFVTSLLAIISLALLRPLILSSTHFFDSWSLTRITVFLKRACLFTVYFMLMSWVSVQYLKRLGLR